MERKVQRSLRGKLKRGLSILLSVAMVLGLVNGPEFTLHVQAAAGLYINENADGSGENRLVSGNASGNGWSYDADKNELTLNGFNGSYIEAMGDLNILLKGENKINITEAGAKYGSWWGLSAGENGKITITGEKANAQDSLLISAEAGSSVSMIWGDVELKGGWLKLIAQTEGSVYGNDARAIRTYNDARLTVDLKGTRGQGLCSLDHRSTGQADISVDFSDEMDDYETAIYSGLYARTGCGPVTVTNKKTNGYAIGCKAY